MSNPYTHERALCETCLWLDRFGLCGNHTVNFIVKKDGLVQTCSGFAVDHAMLGKAAERNRKTLLEAMKAAEHTADTSRLRFGPVGNYAKKIKGEK